MSTLTIVFVSVTAVLLVVAGALFIFGKKAQKKREQQQEQVHANKQTMSMLVIDKKKMRIKDSGLPQMVIDQTPKFMRFAKLPIVKAKIGPQVVTLVCDAEIFDKVPVKKEVKASISGIYIVDIKGIRGSIQPEEKKGLLKRAKSMVSNREKENTSKKSAK